VQFMTRVGRGAAPESAWTDVFGRDTLAFEKRFIDYWMNLPENPTRSSYLKALVQTGTNFYARATVQKQTFADAEAFFKNYKPADLTVNRDLWLPPALFTAASEAALKTGTWSIEAGPGAPPRLVCKDEDGAKYVGTYTLANGRVGRVNVEVTGLPQAAGRSGTPGSIQRAAPAR
jgi:hypothetical protein